MSDWKVTVWDADNPYDPMEYTESFDSKEEAEAFKAGVEWTNDPKLSVSAPYLDEEGEDES